MQERLINICACMVMVAWHSGIGGRCGIQLMKRKNSGRSDVYIHTKNENSKDSNSNKTIKILKI